MFEVLLAFGVVAAIGAVCFWRRPRQLDGSRHIVITEPQDKGAPQSLTNLPPGSRLGAHRGREAAILENGTVLAESAGGERAFPSLAAYREYVGDEKALPFADRPA